MSFETELNISHFFFVPRGHLVNTVFVFNDDGDQWGCAGVQNRKSVNSLERVLKVVL